MAAATADVTSMPGVVAPVAEARMVLRLMDVDAVLDAGSKEVTDVELIGSRYYQNVTAVMA
jgi:hypothetical protein